MKNILALLLVLLVVITSVIVLPITASAETVNTEETQLNNSGLLKLENNIDNNSLEDMLSCPQILTVSLEDAGVRVTWTKVAGAAKYRLYFKAETDEKWTVVSDTTDTTMIHKPEKSNVVYNYTVRSIDKKGVEYLGYNSVPSSILYIAAPILQSATTTKEGTNLKWQPVEGASNYRVYYKVGKITNWQKLGDTKECSFLNKNVEKDIEYTYTVRCISEDGSEFESSFLKDGITTKYLTTPKIVSCSPTEAGIEITWEGIEGADNYRVFVKNGKSWKIIGDSKTTSFEYADAKNNTEQIYTVRALSNDSKSYTSEFDEKGYSYKHYSTPELKGVNDTENGPLVAWKAVSGVSKYQVFYMDENDKAWKTDSSMIVNKTNYTLSKAKAKIGHKYTFTVKCVDDEGKYLSYHDRKGVSAWYLETPEVALTNNSGTINISWESISGADSYMVFIKNDNDDGFSVLGKTKDTTYSYTPNTDQYTYQFSVRCLDKEGKFASSYRKASISTTVFNTGTEIDPTYSGQVVELSDENRDLAERICMGEASVLGFEGMALVAQCLRDTWVKDGYTSIAQILDEYGYDGSTATPGNAEAKAAVRYIFDEGGMAVQHRILIFYASDICKSAYHESQKYVCTCGHVRFFDFW